MIPPAPIRRSQSAKKKPAEDQVVTNPVGVQLLSRPLHAQIFRNANFPPPPQSSINISQTHLKSHGLDISQAQTLPNLSFTLPPLQGSTIDDHFRAIGDEVAGPSRHLATKFSEEKLSPVPPANEWRHWSGWTKYAFADGTWNAERGVGPFEETRLVFDVETMPKEHHYAVMACAASPNAWYCWISPWMLGETSDPAHLIPLGRPTKSDGTPVERIVIGHNIAYDRARVLEEYSLKESSGIRWIDTMALHVAVKGISSVQRPAWMSWNKEKRKREGKTTQLDLDEEGMVSAVESPFSDSRLNADLQAEMEYQTAMDGSQESDASESDGDTKRKSPSRWEDITSVNSLLEVARLYCGIKMNKETRNAFMSDTPQEILSELTKYIDYCANDVYTTHAVFQKVLTLFFLNCPHPVSWAGVMQMGSSFLTVNEEWEKYLERAETKFRELEGEVKGRLRHLAEEAKNLMESGAWKGDVFLEQLDWTPKPATKSRGFWVPTQKDIKEIERARMLSWSEAKKGINTKHPRWYTDLLAEPASDHCRQVIIPLLLGVKWSKQPMFFSSMYGWVYRQSKSFKAGENETIVHPSTSDPISACIGEKEFIFVKPVELDIEQPLWSRKACAKLLDAGLIKTVDDELARELLKKPTKAALGALMDLADKALQRKSKSKSMFLKQLDWSLVQMEEKPLRKKRARISDEESTTVKERAPEFAPGDPLPLGVVPPDGLQYPAPLWPQWYWDLTKPRKGAPRGSIDITVRNRLAPLLLRLGWLGHPLFFSKEHGWCYVVRPKPEGNDKQTHRSSPVDFTHPDDTRWMIDSVLSGCEFYKLPHAHGHSSNVGNPLSKSFIKYAQDGTLASLAKTEEGLAVSDESVNGSLAGMTSTGAGIMMPGESEAKDALDMNAMCSYWISARDRILNQIVIWEKEKGNMGLRSASPDQSSEGEKWGMILPQVITMGTVTRRAIEKTWLTASNAKKDRVGSELKSMVRAPPGYAIVGADVDSEELWISSVMGDAQFGMHGATAIGWMTLEGTKKAGTDLHSKTASILGITRDAAKVFNYSRIYGAGMRHAIQLLLQANPGMALTDAQKLAETLYASTKGKNTHTLEYFGQKLWHGGTESYLFNKLESIAHSDMPKTPALECAVTVALSKHHLPEEFGADYLPSRINWVVQSSGVDYLHLLITSMEHLIRKYGIQAKYMISVHDEVRYLAKEEDKYRAAMALQIANLWTRSLFAYKLELDDLPASVGFFSAVDVDFVLRKEVDMPCVTPSQPTPLPPGESLGIVEVLQKTNNGSLYADKRPMEVWATRSDKTKAFGKVTLGHRAESADFLQAQNTNQIGEVRLSSETWANKLHELGRGDETLTWVKKKLAKKRERSSRDMEMIASSFDVDSDADMYSEVREELSADNR